MLAVPDGNHLLYGKLVLLLPSLLFWPSALGKDAWMVLGIGATAYGAARLFTGRRGSLLWITAGAVACGLVRPHITPILLSTTVEPAFISGATERPEASM